MVRSVKLPADIEADLKEIEKAARGVRDLIHRRRISIEAALDRIRSEHGDVAARSAAATAHMKIQRSLGLAD